MELGRFPLDVIFTCSMLKYWCKLLQLDANHPCKAAYIDMLSRCHMQDNWASNVKNVLNKIGLSYVWNYQSVENVNSFLGIVKQRLQDHAVQHCRSIIEVTSKGRLYKQLNVDFEVQHYLRLLPDKKLIVPMTKLRLSCHKLLSETGSWSRGGRPSIPFSERICKYCNINDIEDEYHFVLTCKKYQHIRNKYIPLYYRNNPSVFKLIKLLSSDQKEILLRISKFLYHAFKIRNISTAP